MERIQVSLSEKGTNSNIHAISQPPCSELLKNNGTFWPEYHFCRLVWQPEVELKRLVRKLARNDGELETVLFLFRTNGILFVSYDKRNLFRYGNILTRLGTPRYHPGQNDEELQKFVEHRGCLLIILSRTTVIPMEWTIQECSSLFWLSHVVSK